MKSTHKTLLGLNIYKISSDYIEKVRELNPQREKFAKNIPEYCVTNNGITFSEYCFQFTSESKEEWLLFDVAYQHPLIEHEIDEIGSEDFFEKINLSEFIKTLPFVTEKEYKKSIPIPTYIVIEIVYINSYDPHTGEYDCEVEYRILRQLEL